MESTKINLTDRQKWALHKIVTGVRDKKLEQTLGGYAGTGKTCLIKYLIQFFPRYAVAAFTGKAANVLRKKGVMASTIHSRIYKPTFENGIVYFDINPDPECEGFIIDEASMVSQEIYEDLKSFQMPMIFVGDHGQLEPVDSKLNLMESPDYTLEEIPADLLDKAKEYREILVEAAIEQDDVLMEQYLAGEPISEADLKSCIRKATIAGAFVTSTIPIITRSRMSLRLPVGLSEPRR